MELYFFNKSFYLLKKIFRKEEKTRKQTEHKKRVRAKE